MNPLRWARVTVVGVFLLGLVVVVGPALWHPASLFRDPFRPAVETRTVETFDAKGVKTGTEVTTGPAGGSLIERSMASGGVLLLRVAVVAVAAYLAGALVYRTISGTFPTEIGGVVFAEAAGGLEKLGANVAELTARLDASAKEVDSIRDAATGAGAAVNEFNEQIDAVWGEVERLSEAVVALGDELRDLRSRSQ
jgi:ABC-type transporter Mla subunit MlaD